MVFREDYLNNRLQRVRLNLTFLKAQYSLKKDECLKVSLQRVFSEYLELNRLKNLLEEGTDIWNELDDF